MPDPLADIRRLIDAGSIDEAAPRLLALAEQQMAATGRLSPEVLALTARCMKRDLDELDPGPRGPAAPPPTP